MKTVLCAILLMILALSAWAKAPVDLGNFQVIDYQKFTQLPRDAQREYLQLIMEVVVAMESSLSETNTQLYPSLSPQQKRTVELWRQLIYKLTIEPAYAAAPNYKEIGSCVYAGWFSTYVDTTNYSQVYGSKPASSAPPKTHCQNPKFSMNPKVAATYKSAQASCSGTSMACNPEIFGYDSRTNKPSCVDVGGITPHNASLACLMAAQADPEPEKRLDKMIDRLASRTDCAEDFNKVVQTIFNSCVCKENPENSSGRNVTIAQGYFDYMKGHRTCYSLLNQTQRLIKRMNERQDTLRSCWIINKDNVEYLSRDLEFISNYTDRVRNLMTPEDKGDYIKTLKRYTKASEEKLDSAPDYENCLAKLKDPTSDKSCKLANGSELDDVIAHCPITIPPLVTRACSIKVTAGDVSSEGIAYSAEATLNPAHPKIGTATFEWKAGENALSGETGASINGKIAASTAGGKEAQLQLSAIITIGKEKFTCAYNDKIVGVQNGCVVAIDEPKYDAGKKEVTASATISKAGGGELAAGSFDKILWKVGEAAEEEGSTSKDLKVAVTAAETNLKVTAKLMKGAAATECTAAEKKVDTAPTEAMTCSISASYDVGTKKLKASATFANKPEGQEDPKDLKWTFPGGDATAGASFEKEIPEQKEKFTVSTKVSFPAQSDAVEPQDVSCSAEVEVKAPEKPADLKCKNGIAVTMVSDPADASKVNVKASISEGGDLAPEGEVTFAGIAFSKEGRTNTSASGDIKLDKKGKKTITANYKTKNGNNVSCSAELELPDAPAATPAPAAGSPQQQQMMQPLPDMPDIFLQGIR